MADKQQDKSCRGDSMQRSYQDEEAGGRGKRRKRSPIDCAYSHMSRITKV